MELARRPGSVGFLRSILRVPEGCSLRFFLQDKFWKWVMRQNRRVPWPVHFTSQVVCPGKVKLGRATYPGDSPHCYIQAINGIEIGDFTNLAPGVGLISANHDPLDNTKHLPGRPLRLGAHCWVGINAVILPEVELGDYTIVGAGAVVTRSFPEGSCVIAGNPARKLRDLEAPGRATARSGNADPDQANHVEDDPRNSLREMD
jgi:acetyltransferase-like isoleucine patch superfamily enzyme